MPPSARLRGHDAPCGHVAGCGSIDGGRAKGRPGTTSPRSRMAVGVESHEDDHSHRADRQHPAAARADRGAWPRRDGDDPEPGPALRRGGPRHHRSGSRPPARRSSPTASSGSTTTSGPTRVHGLPNTAPDGFQIPFAAGPRPPHAAAHRGPFRYQRYADSYLDVAQRYATRAGEAGGHLAVGPEPHVSGRRDPRLLARAVHRRPAARARDRGPRAASRKGAHTVQIDFTEGRLAVKIDPSGDLLHSFIDLNNLALSRFSAEERRRIGVHTCPGGDRDSTHSADVDYAELLPSLFELKAGQLLHRAGRRDGPRARAADHPRSPEAGPARLRRRRRADRPARSRRPRRSGTGSWRRREYIPVDAARHDRRLRLLAVLRRHVDDPRHGVRQDPRAGAWAPRSPRQALGAADESPARRRRASCCGRWRIQNAQSILLARQRAEQELLRAKEALERKTERARPFAGDAARDAGVHHRRHPGDRRARRTSRTSTSGSSRCGGCPATDRVGEQHRQILERSSRPQFADPRAVPSPGSRRSTRRRRARASTSWSSPDGRVFERYSRVQLVDGAQRRPRVELSRHHRAAGAPKRRCATRPASSSC